MKRLRHVVDQRTKARPINLESLSPLRAVELARLDEATAAHRMSGPSLATVAARSSGRVSETMPQDSCQPWFGLSHSLSSSSHRHSEVAATALGA